MQFNCMSEHLLHTIYVCALIVCTEFLSGIPGIYPTINFFNRD